MKLNKIILLLLSPILLFGCDKKIDNNSSSANNLITNINESGNILENQLMNTPIQEKRLSYDQYENLTNYENNGNNTTMPYKEIYDRNLLASYSTPLNNSSDERINNIEIVCERLNNYILKPKETFSYNNTVGPFGPSDGFEEAPILLSDGTKKDGYGGGVCQLSSTLYNVIKNIKNINITERHHHSVPVSYVPEGEDATVSLQSNLDFKFINNNDYSIQFKATCDDSNVTVWAYKVI